ncbi:MAG: sensor histidine kinase [Verrucomicrobia bacterium]|nr:sensor histidine kinase [Verrucomicrobiota bacterium]
MNPLPRLLAYALFVVLAVLAALLATPAWRGAAPDPAARREPGTSVAESAVNPPPRAARLAAAVPKLAFAVALIGVVLAVALLFSMSLRGARGTESGSPFVTVRQEIGTLARLAESSVAQGAELSRERDVRRRAEEDAQMKQHLLSQSLDEKIRLGRDLHDGIIQSLYAVGLTLETLRAQLKSDPDAAERRLEETRAALNATIRDVRAYITGLAPENLKRASFGQALRSVLGELRAGREVEFAVEIDDEATSLLNADQTVEALQIAREAVSNALRHGAATRVAVRVHQGDQEIGLLVQDNGAGFDASTTREGGHGLHNMRARADRIGARIKLTSQPSEGTRLVLTVPVHPIV